MTGNRVVVTLTFATDRTPPCIATDLLAVVGNVLPDKLIGLDVLDPFADGVCPFDDDLAPGAGCIKPAGHDGPHVVTPGDTEDDE